MKIFYFSGAMLPSQSAHSVHVMKMCCALAADAKDNAVTLFAKGGRGVTDEEIFEYYGVDENFSLVLPFNSKIPVLSGILRMIGHHWALKEYGRPNLSYGRDPVELFYLLPPRAAIVFEAHQLPTSLMQRRAVRNLATRKNFRMVVITEALKKDYLKAYPKLKAERVFVAPDGADVPKNPAAAKELAGRSDVLKVGYTGSLHEGKGMEVIALLAKEAPGFDFHVVGGSAEQVEAWKSRGLSENVFLHGHVPHGDVPSYTAACDILIAPYRSSAKIKTGRDIARWISPLKIFEYMAAKKPILCADLPVIREVLNDSNAILVKPDDVKGWVAALERLKDPTVRTSLAEVAFIDLEQKYSWAQRARNILKFVDKGI